MSKKILHSIGLLLLLLLCNACGNNHTQGNIHEQVIADEGFRGDSLAGTYACYKGVIAGELVTLHLTIHDTVFRGAYYYDKNGISIELGNWDDTNKSDNEIYLTEFPPERTDSFAHWLITFTDDSIKGTWYGTDTGKQYPIILGANNSEGIQHFGVVVISDSARLVSILEEPSATISFQLLVPIGNDDKTKYVRDVIMQCIGCDSIGEDKMFNCLKTSCAAYLRDYKESNKEFSISSEEEQLTSAYTWNLDETYTVIFNDNDLLVIDNYIYNYSGGAHGYYSNNYTNIDRLNKRVLELDDIMNVDSTVLLPILETEVRNRLDIKSGELLSTRMLAEELYVPESFYIGNKGITFVYGLYEIASYADGIIQLFIPYDKITNQLTPTFKQRMGLEELTANN